MISPEDMTARPAGSARLLRFLSQRVLPVMIDGASGVERRVQVASQGAALHVVTGSALAVLAGYVVGRAFYRRGRKYYPRR